VTTENNLGIDVATGAKKEKILKEFEIRNQELQNGQWKEGWQKFCEKSQGVYRGVLRGLELPETTEEQTQLFAHFLDCEAHTDVWRQLFPTWNNTNEK